MARILVTEAIADSGLDRLRAAGHEVDVRTELSPAELLEAVAGAHALIIRSATEVTDEVLAAGSDLLVVGRAGIGLDNVDTEAATRRGVMVVNAPQSNIVSAAEHTMALLLAQARNVPQAHAALVAGRWERSRWEGVEIADKTLGIAGLGRIGKLVADRARAFGMRLIAFDPFVSADRGRQLGVDLLPLDQVVAESDFLTIHLPKTPETKGLIGRELLLKAKPGLRVINVARGGIVDEAALADAIRDGVVAGAALDVFDTEPTTSSPLFALDAVVVTPHLGASTREAQDKAGDTIADMVQLALAGDFVPFAVNLAAAEAHDDLRPFLPLAERLGRAFGSLVSELPATIEIAVEGDIGGYDTRIIGLSVLKGVFGGISEEPVTYVNAPQRAREAGVDVREVSSTASADWVNLITISGGGHSVAGTLSGRRAEHRIVLIDGNRLDVPPAEHMLMVANDDRPGVIGTVGTILGNAGVNIADMDVGRSVADEHGASPGTAVMLIAPSSPVPPELVDALRAAAGIIDVVAFSA
jgi:D-3-phosphoglycerate dehydrogenase / 2-oxoglutarate reductase